MLILQLLLLVLFLYIIVTNSNLRSRLPSIIYTNSANSQQALFIAYLYIYTQLSTYTTSLLLANAAYIALILINQLYITFLFCNCYANYYLGSSMLIAYLLRRSSIKLYSTYYLAILSTNFSQLIIKYAVISLATNLLLSIYNNSKLAKICCYALAIIL